MNLELLKEQISVMKKKVPDLKSAIADHNEVIIIGNGGSNSIASHIAQDYTKAMKKKSFTFSDPSRLTCYINDYGMENAYRQFVEEFASDESLVILISSSGESNNIINTARYCTENSISLVTLSGFESGNRLNDFPSLVNYWVDSKDYGIVECAHLIFLHSIITYD